MSKPLTTGFRLNAMQEEIIKLRAELDAARKRFDKEHSALEDERTFRADDVRRLQIQNAQLAAALRRCREIVDSYKPHPLGCDCLTCIPWERLQNATNDNSTALCDLLLPLADELLSASRHARQNNPEAWAMVQAVEIRLRSLAEGKEGGEK